MAQIHETVDVEVPLWTAYDQWTQFELFHEFMDHVAQTEQLEDDLVRFTTTIGGVRRTFIARIQEQRPDRMIRWQDTDRPAHHGEIRFEPVGPDATRLDVSILWNPGDVVEAIGSFFKLDRSAFTRIWRTSRSTSRNATRRAAAGMGRSTRRTTVRPRGSHR